MNQLIFSIACKNDVVDDDDDVDEEEAHFCFQMVLYIVLFLT